jgi:hypothetical protein
MDAGNVLDSLLLYMEQSYSGCPTQFQGNTSQSIVQSANSNNQNLFLAYRKKNDIIDYLLSVNLFSTYIYL